MLCVSSWSYHLSVQPGFESYPTLVWISFGLNHLNHSWIVSEITLVKLKHNNRPQLHSKRHLIIHHDEANVTTMVTIGYILVFYNSQEFHDIQENVCMKTVLSILTVVENYFWDNKKNTDISVWWCDTVVKKLLWTIIFHVSCCIIISAGLTLCTVTECLSTKMKSQCQSRKDKNEKSAPIKEKKRTF